MTSLADDLLRSRTIPELRELVYSLEKDSGSKKTELQHMVGSKYHDFIQSADKIASMKEKSVLIEQQIQQFWNSNQQLLAKAQTILKYSQPHHRKHQKLQNTLPVEGINSSSIWSKLNDCNVYEATKLVLLAQSLSIHSINPHSKQYSILTFVDATTTKSLHHFARKLSEDVHRQLSSSLFLRETVLDDANMLLLCDAELSPDSAKPSGVAGSSSVEVVQKAKAIAASSLLHNEGAAPTAAALLQAYLAAAEVRVQDLLETHLTVSNKIRAPKSESVEDTNGTETDNEAKMGHGITSMVKLLQQILIDVHLLFLSPIDPSSFNAAQDGSNAASSHSPMGFNAPVLGLVGLFQRLLLSETAEHLLQYAHTSSVTASPHSPVNTPASPHVAFDLTRAFAELGGVCSTGTGSSAVVREQRKVFKHWLEGLFARVTKQCKVVLSSLTSAAEVAQLQQQVWAACVSVSSTEPHTSATASAASHALTTRRGQKEVPSSSASHSSSGTLDASLSALYTYNQQTWERASEILLSGTSGVSAQSMGVDGATTAPTYLWCGVFRPCFLHQVERLLKRSCDEVLAHTKLQILRTLRQQGVTMDPNTLKITSHGPAASHSATGKKASNMLSCSDYSADVSHLSSPRLYQMAEKIRQQFEQDITRLLADVVEPVQNTESTPTSTADLEGLGNNPAIIAGDSADPQSIGALARAMRTQCAQLVGHTLVLVRNLVEACQRALKDRGALPARGGSGSGSDDLLYECLHNSDSQCILTPDLLEIIKKHSGGGGSADHTSASIANKDRSEGRHFDRGDHTLLSSLLFLGRLAWLFKIRGNFLDFALQPKAALLSTPHSAGLGSGSVDAGASSGNILRARSNSMTHNNSFRVGGGAGGGNNEDQFRSAFEIADTNGDGVLSYAEAIEALQALSGESDVTASNKGESTKPTTVASAFNLSAQLTPTLTYTEFALICGSTLLSSDAAQPVLRLQRCLEHIITAAHVTWAVSVVHMLGRTLRAQYLADLGFAYSSQPAAAAGSFKPSKVDEKIQKKPFKVSWVSKWIDLDGHVEDDVSGNNGSAQKEHVLIPGGLCVSLRVFLHKMSQHSTSALVSIDTLQTASATVPAVHKRPYVLVGAENGSNGTRASSSNYLSKTGAKPIRDEFSDLLGEIEEVPESDGEEEEEDSSAFFEASGLLATLAGWRKPVGQENGIHQEGSCKVVLAHLTTRLVAQLSLAYVHAVSMSVLHEARPRGTSATASAISSAARLLQVSNEAMEEAALQCVFDLSVTQQLALPWNMPEWMHSSTTKHHSEKPQEAVGFITAVAAWTAQVDPITAELVLPLVRAATLAHLQGTALLAPHCDSSVLTAAASADHSLRATSTSSSNNGAKSSEQLLASVFPSAGHSAPRFALLPLAISTNPVPVAASGRSGLVAGAGAPTTRYTGAVASSDANNRSTTPVAASTPASNVARGVMNWFG